MGWSANPEALSRVHPSRAVWPTPAPIPARPPLVLRTDPVRTTVWKLFQKTTKRLDWKPGIHRRYARRFSSFFYCLRKRRVYSAGELAARPDYATLLSLYSTEEKRSRKLGFFGFVLELKIFFETHKVLVESRIFWITYHVPADWSAAE